MSAAPVASSFSVPQARAILGDLFAPRAAIYWTDMIVSMAVGYTAASLYLTAPLLSLQQLVCLAVASFALFRLGSFIHEIVHFRRGQMTPFTIAWNVLAGIPMLMPSFFYENHIDHHNTHHYGTGQDGEYLPLGSSSWLAIVKFFGQVLLLPAWVAVRFLIITPISFLHPRLRQWALQRASSFVINWKYRRRSIPADAPRCWWAALEWACFARTAAIFAFIGLGLAPLTRIPLLYVLAMCVLGLNYVRNLVAHHYLGDGHSMSHTDQLLDSVNITGLPLLTELFFPLGLRLHALHHLFPALPYHNLPAAHARLMERLPADSAYRRTVYPSYLSVLAEWRRQRRAAAAEHRDQTWFARREDLLRTGVVAGRAPAVVPSEQTDPIARSA